jgi:hypothetical protein
MRGFSGHGLKPAEPSMRPIDPKPLAFALALSALAPCALAQVQVQAAATDQPAPASADAPADGASAKADSGDYWRLMASPYMVHRNSSPEHEPVYMVGLERQRSDGWVWGGVYFSNSFGQPSGYVYLGEKVNNFSRWDKLFFQWTAGILYGYKEPYEDKVPFNVNGFSPGATVSLGWQFTRTFSAQAILLGAAGLMLQVAIDLR